ncbi:salivary glue protein Sgs-3-like [Thunnus albacares]|uniref:salivary glue protein Sgs-3-like n=1 Tax=Thunnus albacares TaxID=8236 RepID=UPI001CF6A867|nr:salivary glue protein Sgs-3-like [Thunnus albacares]
MEKTGKLVLCVCLTFMLIGSTKGVSRTSETNMTMTTSSTNETATSRPTVTTPMPHLSSTHVTSNDHTNSTSPTRPRPSSPTSAVSTTSTTVTVSSWQTTVSKGTTQNPEATNHTDHHSPNGTVGVKSTTVAATSKGGSSSLFRSCSQLLVPIIAILICGA